MPIEPQHPSEDPGTAGVRAVLQAFQDGYARRDPEQSHAFMDLFVPDADLEVVGTGAETSGDGEWCLGPDAVHRLVESDWRHWGDLRVDVAGARIHRLGDVAWLATQATVTEQITPASNFDGYVAFAREILDEDRTSEMKLLELVRTGTHALFEIAQGETYIWPLRFTAVLVHRDGRWRFHQMQFSYPTTRYPDVRHPGKA